MSDTDLRNVHVTVPSITSARISRTEDLGTFCIILTELSTSQKIKAKCQNVCTVLYLDFHLRND